MKITFFFHGSTKFNEFSKKKKKKKSLHIYLSCIKTKIAITFLKTLFWPKIGLALKNWLGAERVKKQEDKHPSIIPGNKAQLPGDAFGATPEVSNNKKKSPQRSNPALNSNFRKIRNINIRGRPCRKVLPRTTS